MIVIGALAVPNLAGSETLLSDCPTKCRKRSANGLTAHVYICSYIDLDLEIIMTLK